MQVNNIGSSSEKAPPRSGVEDGFKGEPNQLDQLRDGSPGPARARGRKGWPRPVDTERKGRNKDTLSS